MQECVAGLLAQRTRRNFYTHAALCFVVGTHNSISAVQQTVQPALDVQLEQVCGRTTVWGFVRYSFAFPLSKNLRAWNSSVHVLALGYVTSMDTQCTSVSIPRRDNLQGRQEMKRYVICRTQGTPYCFNCGGLPEVVDWYRAR